MDLVFPTLLTKLLTTHNRFLARSGKVWVYQVPNVMDLDPLAMSCQLNERPVTVHGKLV